MTRVLVTGATGYLGGRLIPELLEAGHKVRCLARTPVKLDGEPWRADVEVVAGDVTDPASLDAALGGIGAAYYLVHSIGGGPFWVERDRRGAESFRDAATRAGLDQIIYLGGLGADGGELSEHLASRHEVGDVLREGPVAVTELRAAVVIGSGSASFEMLRHLVEKLPAMVTPRWVRSRCQPIAVRDVLTDLAWSGGTVFEDRRSVASSAPPPAVFRAVTGIGGDRGWYSASWLWTLRGLVNLLAGGVGPHRGRRHPDDLAVGDAVDAWRVEEIERDALLRLRAEMRMPGQAWLEWSIEPDGSGSRLHQRARFAPRGLLGRCYWYALVPVHGVMFNRMSRRLAAAAEAGEIRPAPEAPPWEAGT